MARKLARLITLLCVAPLLPGVARAQQDAEGGPPADTSAARPGNTLVPLPVIFYQPETKLGFGGLVSYYFQIGNRVPEPGAPYQPSNLTLVGIYTTEKQIVISLGGELFLSGGRNRVVGDVGYIKFPTKYWGIGNETPDSNEEDYTPESVGGLGEVLHEVARGWFVGVGLQAGYRAVTEIDSGGAFEAGVVPGSDDGWAIGPGVLLTRDTRNSTVYPTRGGYHQLRAFLYDGAFGSDFDWGGFVLDMRGYFPVFRSQVVALRALSLASSGAPPFEFMPQLGGEQLLRGYFQGRYRDRQLLAFQGEVRTPVWWRFGMAGFVGVGQVGDVFGDFSLGGFHVSAGGGLRFEISRQEGLNLRADYGWGFDVGSGGFYLSIGETF